MNSNRSGYSWLWPALLTLSAGLAVAGCGEQKILNGFSGDITPPIVSIVKTKGDTIDVNDGLQFSVSAADNLGLKTLSISFTGGYTAQIDSTFRTALTSITLPVLVNFPKNTSAGGKVLIKVTATDGNANSSTAQDSIVLTNKDALIVTLVRPLTGAVTSAGKQVLVQVNAHQNKGITKIGWISAGAGVTGSDSVLFGPPLDTTSVGPTFTDTLTVPASSTSGIFTVTGFAEDALNRRVTTVATPVSIQSVATDNTPPVVTFTVPKRAEVRDSISVRATDPSGIILLGWTATNKTTGALVGADSIASSGVLTDVSQQFNLNFNITTFPQDVYVQAFAVDAANNRGFATLGVGAAAPTRTDTVTIVNGITKPLPRGGRVADAIYNPITTTYPQGAIYMTNVDQNRVEVFSIADTAFKASIPVGARPWGIALWPANTATGANLDYVVVANSGGTDLSIVDGAASREVRRHALPNFLIQSVQTTTNGTGTIVLKITEYDFSDRPEYLGMTCRPAGGPCAVDQVYAVYSTTPTKGQSGTFADHGTLRWENLGHPAGPPAVAQSHFFWEHAEGAPSPGVTDTLQIVIDRGPTIGQSYQLSAACGVTVRMTELAFLDTTFVRNSGDFTHAFVGEGGQGTSALGFARAIGYNGTAGRDNSTCTGQVAPPTGPTFSGPLQRDSGVSPAIRVRDLISNAAVPVRGVGINFNGLTNLIRADSVYVLDAGLRLRGLLSVSGTNPGMDLNFNHNFDAGCIGTGASCFPNAPNSNDRLLFAARDDANIDVFDTFYYGLVASIPLRDPVIGPLRVAKLPSGDQVLVGVTAKGVVTARLPAATPIVNPFPSPRRSAARSP